MWGLGVSCAHRLHTNLAMAKSSHGAGSGFELWWEQSSCGGKLLIYLNYWVTVSSRHLWFSLLSLFNVLFYHLLMLCLSLPLSSPVADFTGRSTSSRPPLPCPMEGASSQVTDVVCWRRELEQKERITCPSVTGVRFFTSRTNVIKQKYSSIPDLGVVGKEKSD